MSDNARRTCIDCGQEKPATSRYFYSNNPDHRNLYGRCRECIAASRDAPKPPAPPSGQKFCIKCNLPKPADRIHFPSHPRTKDGLANVCRVCRNAQEKQTAQARKKPSPPPPPPREEKPCIKCGEVKQINEKNFRTKANGRDGFYNVCRECMYKQDTERVQRRHQETPPVFSEDVLKECITCHECWPMTPSFFDQNARKKDGLDPSCKACKKERSKDYQLKYADEIQWRHFMYRQEHRESIREKGRLYGRAHRAEINARVRDRYGQIKQNGGTYTASDVLNQYQKQEGKCHWCDKQLDEYHVDHIIPVSRGGSDDPENIVIACPFCNRSKGNKTVEEWIAYLEKFILPKMDTLVS